ncbi:MAG: ABC transporter ATP-binding protein/permease [Propionibacteriaceae bacterium]|jgi:ATP-binding cassette subfamily B protein|nr:ABC transporter ATP-binding protein/permease [Propionibacteriaceae bacterium]
MKSPLGRLVWRFGKPYGGQFLLVVLSQFASTLANLYLPRMNADIIDSGLSQGDTHYIWVHGGFMLAVSAGQIVCQICAVYFGAKLAMRLGRDVRGALFERALEFSAREIGHFGAPSLITRNTNDVQQVQMVVMMICTMILSAPITMIGGVVMALRTNVAMSWIIAAAVGLLAIVAGIALRLMSPLFAAMQKRLDRLNQVLREHISGIRVVRAFVREPHEAARFARANADVMEMGLKAGRIMMTLFPLVMMILNLSTVGVMFYGAGQIDSGHLQIGQLTAFLSYLMQILMSVMMAVMMLVLLPRAAVCAQRIMEVLDTALSIRPPASPMIPATDTTASEASFKAVDFRYPGAESALLHDIDFDLLEGQTTAVIGATGSGKTTLVNLIPRLFDVSAGQVEVGGVDVRQFDPEELWRRIGLVPQKTYLFSGTVASNLRFGRPEADDDELWRALAVAQADDFVRQMDGQLEAAIAQGGTNLSGGQRQRLSIARAIVKRPQLYVFDDSFSALDVATDARLREALAAETERAAVLIVAQRVSTIRQADQIIVLDDGTIVGRGGHDELLRTCPTYAEIVESQLSAEEVAA